MTSNLQVK